MVIPFIVENHRLIKNSAVISFGAYLIVTIIKILSFRQQFCMGRNREENGLFKNELLEIVVDVTEFLPEIA